MAAHGHDLSAPEVARDTGDRIHPHQGGAVNLPEQLRVQLVDQLFDRLANQRLDAGGLHPGVLFVADEKQHLGHRDHLDALAHAGLNPVQVLGRAARVQLRRQPVQQLLDRGHRVALRGGIGVHLRRVAQQPAAADALGRELQPCALSGLEHVVANPLLEGVDRVLVVGGDEHDLRQVLVVGHRHLGDLAGRVDAGQAGHADVEKHDVRPVLGHQRHRLQPVARFGHDLQLWPGLSQAGAQLFAHQALVVGDHGAQRGIRHDLNVRQVLNSRWGLQTGFERVHAGVPKTGL